MKRIAAALLCFLLIINLCSCDFEQEETVNLTAMNTLMQIRVFSSLNGKKEATELLKEEILRCERLFDVNLPESDVYKINESEDGCGISEDTAEIIRLSLFASEKTEGAFDITVMPVLKLWGFDNGNYSVPKNDKLLKALSKVDYKSITVDGNYFKKREGTEISLGAIAKGYLGDRLLEIAKEKEICGIISLGGNIVLCGENEEKGFWTVGVKNPHSQNELACTFQSKGNLSVVTSGAYERYFEKDSKTYHHIIDTKTGEPSKSDLLSVTVIGESGALCDAYSTALFVMGKEKAVAFAKENNDFEYIFITDKNEIIATDGVEALEARDGFKIK